MCYCVHRAHSSLDKRHTLHKFVCVYCIVYVKSLFLRDSQSNRSYLIVFVFIRQRTAVTQRLVYTTDLIQNELVAILQLYF